MAILNKQSRKGWIDALRGVALLFVLFGHLIPEYNSYFAITSPIKIPLFFVITGMVFNQNRKDNNDFYSNLLKKLVFPWLILTTVPGLLFIPFKGGDYFTTHLWNVISGKITWYMPCCIIAEIIHFNLLKLQSRKFIRTASIFVFVIGLVLCELHVLDFAMTNRALVAQGFIIIGYELRNVLNSRLKSFSMAGILFLLLIYMALILLTLHFYPGESLDVHTNTYYNYPICMIMIIIGCTMMTMLFNYINDFPKVLVFIGQNTLVYYIWSSYSSLFFVKILSFLGLGLDNIGISIIVLVLMCCSLGICAMIVNRFFPFAVGKRA